MKSNHEFEYIDTKEELTVAKLTTDLMQKVAKNLSVSEEVILQ